MSQDAPVYVRKVVKALASCALLYGRNNHLQVNIAGRKVYVFFFVFIVHRPPENPHVFTNNMRRLIAGSFPQTRLFAEDTFRFWVFLPSLTVRVKIALTREHFAPWKFYFFEIFAKI